MGGCLSRGRDPPDDESKATNLKTPIMLQNYEGEPRNPVSPYSTSFRGKQPIDHHMAARSRLPFPNSDGLNGSPHFNPPMPRNVSELIDPESLIAEGTMVQSPSGSLLTRDDFYAREDRPLSMRERQERIRLQMIQNQNYAISGIPDRTRSGQPSPSNFAMYDIVEEEASAPNSPESKRGQRSGFAGKRSKDK